MNEHNLVSAYLAQLAEVLGHPIKSDHLELIAILPSGAWRWASTTLFPGHVWPMAHISLVTSSVRVNLRISLTAENEEAGLLQTSSRYNEEKGHTVADLAGSMSLSNLRDLVLRLLKDYAPLSVGITTTE